ncbi:hypothetical protein EG329_006400 [Mollisiaceae sp. DMI_Dod_QoI]|nr:hypothetical protein EG329_006400 [Helotiales sp. DMI_Dod_QoI]
MHFSSLEEIFEVFEKILEYAHCLEYLAFLLGYGRQCLLCGCKFAEFSNRRRPKCTTMPWTIWPSLVVLWGVCWMFYTPFNFRDQSHFQAIFGDEYITPFSPALSFGPSSPAAPRDFDHFWGNLDLDLDGTVSFPYMNRDMNDYHSNSFQQNLAAQTSSVEAVGSTVDFKSPFDHTSMSTAKKVNEAMPATSEGVSKSHLNTIQPSSLHAGYHHPPSMLPVAIASSSRHPGTPLLQETPATLEQRQSPSLSADGKIICIEFGCTGDQTFRRPSDWQTHMNKHTRPFYCSIKTCHRGKSGFATKGEADRHVSLVHHRRRLATTIPSDKLKLAKASAGTDIAGESAGSIEERVSTSTQDKRKRVSTNDFDAIPAANEASDQNNALENVLKRAKVVDHSTDVASSTTSREEDLVKENEKLRRQLERKSEELERHQTQCGKEREMLLGIIDRLTKQGK